MGSVLFVLKKGNVDNFTVFPSINWFFNSEVDHDFEQFIILMPGSGVFRGGPS